MRSTRQTSSRIAAALLLVDATTAGDRGATSCPCRGTGLGSPSISISERTAEGGETYAYPAQYGATCAAHDANMPPTCSENPAPAWCALQWCFVDPAECSVDMVALSSAYWDHVELYISYETCQQPTAAGGTAGPSSMAASVLPALTRQHPFDAHWQQTVSKEASKLMQSLWTPFMLNYLTTAAVGTTFVDMSDLGRLAHLMFYQYNGYFEWSPPSSASTSSPSSMIAPNSVYLATPDGVFIQWHYRVNSDTWEKSIRMEGNSTFSQQSWGNYTITTVPPKADGDYVATSCPVGDTNCRDRGFTNSFLVDDSSAATSFTSWFIYDPRVRPWFTAATSTYTLSNRTRQFSEIYLFAVTNLQDVPELGLTATTLIADSGGSIVAILGIDFLLSDIKSRLLEWFPEPSREFAFVAERDWTLVSVSSGEVVDSSENRLTARASNDPITSAMMLEASVLLDALGWPETGATVLVRMAGGSRLLRAERIQVLNIDWIFCRIETFRCAVEKKFMQTAPDVLARGGCSTCPEGLWASKHGRCDLCQPDYFALLPDDQCKRCDSIAMSKHEDWQPDSDALFCPGGAKGTAAGICPVAGFYVHTAERTGFQPEIIQCETPQACEPVANCSSWLSINHLTNPNVCGTGCEGWLCATCKLGYDKIKRRCVECNGVNWSMLLLGLGSYLATVLFLLHKSTQSVASADEIEKICRKVDRTGNGVFGVEEFRTALRMVGVEYEGGIVIVMESGDNEALPDLNSESAHVARVTFDTRLAEGVAQTLGLAQKLRAAGIMVDADDDEAAAQYIGRIGVDRSGWFGSHFCAKELRVTFQISDFKTLFTEVEQKQLAQRFEGQKLAGLTVKSVDFHRAGTGHETLTKLMISDFNARWSHPEGKKLRVKEEELLKMINRKELVLQVHVEDFVRMRSKASPSATLNIFVFFGQTFFLLAQDSSFFGLSNVFNLDIEDAAEACLLPLSYSQRFIGKVLLMPLLLLGCLFPAKIIWKLLRNREHLLKGMLFENGIWPWMQAPPEISSVHLRRASINIFMFCFAPLTRSAIQVFVCINPCEADDQCDRVLVFDMGVRCHEGEHLFAEIVAACVLSAFVVAFIFLWRQVNKAVALRRSVSWLTLPMAEKLFDELKNKDGLLGAKEVAQIREKDGEHQVKVWRSTVNSALQIASAGGSGGGGGGGGSGSGVRNTGQDSEIEARTSKGMWHKARRDINVQIHEGLSSVMKQYKVYCNALAKASAPKRMVTKIVEKKIVDIIVERDQSKDRTELIQMSRQELEQVVQDAGIEEQAAAVAQDTTAELGQMDLKQLEQEAQQLGMEDEVKELIENSPQHRFTKRQFVRWFEIQDRQRMHDLLQTSTDILNCTLQPDSSWWFLQTVLLKLVVNVLYIYGFFTHFNWAIWLHTTFIGSALMLLNRQPYISKTDTQLELFSLLSLAGVSHITSLYTASLGSATIAWSTSYVALSLLLFLVPAITWAVNKYVPNLREQSEHDERTRQSLQYQTWCQKTYRDPRGRKLPNVLMRTATGLLEGSKLGGLRDGNDEAMIEARTELPGAVSVCPPHLPLSQSSQEVESTATAANDSDSEEAGLQAKSKLEPALTMQQRARKLPPLNLPGTVGTL